MEKINLNNISLSYETMGQGSDVLLLHGFPSSMYMWNDIKNKLVENGYRVTILEQRGYPLSRLKNFDLLIVIFSPILAIKFTRLSFTKIPSDILETFNLSNCPFA